ncbi:MAG: DUF411 domain-containing protein [Hyphomicrobiaceae bacterium]
MKPAHMMLSRRRLLALLGVAPLAVGLPAAAETLAEVVVHRDPSCGCCGAWAEHLRRAGFPVKIVETGDINAIKRRLGVPPDLISCHTAEVGGYVVEGHVPARAIRRLLTERPQAAGLAVPGMPIGSPGMEGGAPDTYEVVVFGELGHRVFARYLGDREL